MISYNNADSSRKDFHCTRLCYVYHQIMFLEIDTVFYKMYIAVWIYQVVRKYFDYNLLFRQRHPLIVSYLRSGHLM